jgi:hypothetical protein
MRRVSFLPASLQHISEGFSAKNARPSATGWSGGWAWAPVKHVCQVPLQIVLRPFERPLIATYPPLSAASLLVAGRTSAGPRTLNPWIARLARPMLTSDKPFLVACFAAPPGCENVAVLANVMNAVLIVYSLGLVVYMAMRRTQIRRALGISGAPSWGKL